jgi:hypothetical protein
MIKVGFICEGYTEKILLESPAFKAILANLNIETAQIINAEGCENLLPKNIQAHVTILEDEGAQILFILTDLDNAACISHTKNRVSARPNDIVIVACKKIEAWFLAGSSTMSQLLKTPNFKFDNPEEEKEPFETINQLLIDRTGRGVGRRSGKTTLANRMIQLGFDLSDAAAHPNCPSAKYFLIKLKEVAPK